MSPESPTFVPAPTPPRLRPGSAEPRGPIAKHNETQRRLQAQFEKLERQFAQIKEQNRQVQKLASLGTNAAVLAHEFNNLMSPVVGYARYAVNAGDPELMAKALNMTLRQTAIVTAMSDRILGLAANETRAAIAVSLCDAVADAEACLCRDLSKDGITLVNGVEAGITVQADPGQLQQVLFNLLLNARQAIQHRNGRIRITADRETEGRIAVHVADNGAGIPADRLPEIFNAFYSTKKDRPDKSGIGLGLTLCKEIVEEHGGAMRVASEPDRGTTFTFSLPQPEDKPQPEPRL
jgi:two-component system NtrC family sensor kinase